MGKVTGLRCVSCGRVYPKDSKYFTCPSCGNTNGTLSVLYDYDHLHKTLNRDNWIDFSIPSHFRYINLLPFEDRTLIPVLQTGMTPIYRAHTLEKKYGQRELYIKDDSRNPTGSYKDRASSIALVKATEEGQKAIVVASTGNAASSMAGFAASADLPLYVLVPERIPEAKLAQLVAYNAKVIKIRGTYDMAFELSLKLAESEGFYLRSTAVNPYLSEGKKTGAFEIAEQLNYNLPDYVFVPVGDGCIIESVYKGFVEMKEIGITTKIPMLVGVQAKGASPLVHAFENGREHFTPVENPYTIADSISVGFPRDGVKALKAVKNSHGMFLSVEDMEIQQAISELGSNTGVFAEPAAATAFAGYKKAILSNKIDRNASVLIMITGSGLKDIQAVMQAINPHVPLCDPSIESIKDGMVFYKKME